MILPSKSPITLRFGATTSPYSIDSPHAGVDFASTPDNKIYAPFAGKVTQITNNGRDGNGTYMTDSQGRFHGLLHAAQYLVSNQSFVQEGQPIAVMGETGFAQGVHLHWCVKQNEVFIDPLTLVKETPMLFNEGDRKNVNAYLYGEDLKRFKAAPGKEFKDAMYYGVFETDEFRIDQLVNPGDVAAINAAFGRTDGDTMVGKTWKTVFYEYTIKHIPKEGCSAEERQFLDLRKKI